MERPECPLCKAKHFAREPHAFKNAVTRVGESVRPALGRQPEHAPVVVVSKFNRTAYQREYMRAYRKKKSLIEHG